MAESTIGLYKTELIHRQGPWRTPEQVELATLEYIDWWNNRRLHTEIGDIPPAEKEEMYYAEQELNEKASCVRQWPPSNPARSIICARMASWALRRRACSFTRRRSMMIALA